MIDLRSEVDALTYKPGWKFTTSAVLGRPQLIVTAAVLHSETLEPCTFEVKRIVPQVALADTKAFLSWWEDILAETEIHEMREFARYHGELIDNPHATEEEK